MWLLVDTLDYFLVAGLLLGSAAFLLLHRRYDRLTRDATPSNAEVTQAIATKEGSQAQRLQKEAKRLVIFYGSQTGTAEGFAQDLAKVLARFHLPALVMDPEDIHLVRLLQFLRHCLESSCGKR